MVCIYCGSETSVTNSRLQKRNNHVWRRRRCLDCDSVFTTTERAIFGPDMAFKDKKGKLMPFRREKLLHSLLMALGGQPEHYTHAESLTDNIIGRLLRKKTGAVIDRADLIAICKTTLRRYDRSAHLRYLAEHG